MYDPEFDEEDEVLPTFEANETEQWECELQYRVDVLNDLVNG